MVYFQTKNPNLGKFWRDLDWKMLIYFMAIWNILRAFEICYAHWIRFLLIWYIFSGFGTMYREKSGNPGQCHKINSCLVLQRNSVVNNRVFV
jgi:hypothetical protein